MMNFKPTRMHLARLAMAAASVGLLAPLAALAADDKAPGARAGSDRSVNNYSDRAQMKTWSSDKEQLESAMKPGQNRDFYTKAIADRGYRITSVNVDKPQALEVEIVKGSQTYEVQLDFDQAGKATEVDVATNMWRSDATKAAMGGKQATGVAKYQRGNEAYSDSARMATWTDEKERLEKALAPGNDKDFYRQELGKLGYKVTSVNDREKDYLEYEVVKGKDSFEVQIDLEGAKATNVDVTTNMWQSQATERALLAAPR